MLSTGYSIWTNTNYKNPLIASAVACLLGNVCYCLSYDLGAVWLLFVARLITGFGEPMCIRPALQLPCKIACMGDAHGSLSENAQQ